MKESNKRVLVGMSGGIDSTATCLMLQEQGYEIVGVTMRVWGDEPQDARELLLNSSRSDDNPNGFTIEGFTIIENKDLQLGR